MMPQGPVVGAGQQTSSSLLRRLMPAIILAGIAILVFTQGWHSYLSPKTIAYRLEDIQSYISGNLLLSVLAYMGIYIAIVALSLPGGALLTLTGGLLFGWMVAAPVTVVAATIGATIIFMVARTSFGEPLAARAGPWLHKLRDGFQENAFNYLLFLRLVPAFPFVIVNLAPALLGVPLKTYVLGTLIGIIPGTFAYSYFGRGLDSVLDAGRTAYEACVAQKGEAGCAFPFDPSVLITKDIVIAIAGLGVVALIPVILKKFRQT